MYSSNAYNRMPPQPPAGPSSKRYPLANAVNHHALNQHPHYNPMQHQQQQMKQQQHQPPTPPPKGVAPEGAKAPSSPPLPRQNSKTRPPSPPKVISDKGGRLFFNRVGFLGEVRSLSRCFAGGVLLIGCRHV